VPHNMLPDKLMREDNGFLAPLQPGDHLLHRHQSARIFARNGPAILIVSRHLLAANPPSLYGPRTIPFPMPMDNSLDLDFEEDWKRAEQFLHLLLPLF